MRVLCPGLVISCHTKFIEVQSNHTLRLITGAIRSTSTYWLPLLSSIYPFAISRSEILFREYRKLQENLHLPIQEDIPRLQRNSQMPILSR
ncbi:hypothetical protein Trydic_g11241 [Trypoxylus dichotomus]